MKNRVTISFTLIQMTTSMSFVRTEIEFSFLVGSFSMQKRVLVYLIFKQEKYYFLFVCASKLLRSTFLENFAHLKAQT